MPRFAVAPALLLLAPLALVACVEGMPADPTAPKISQRGTCFAYVGTEPGGQFSLITGKGDGTLAPAAQKVGPMSADKVDAALAHEIEVMQVMPECLAVYARNRAAAQPAPAPVPAPAG
ncbi:hypothetical protein [Rhodobacter maris]|uniref:Lipoprotein n=1 Tax=Rhodobacter maris TaxID=446682 RepID=A0A285S6Q9_9RHOB|nr:hypothetical protein [Rhodobacter maris]SOC02983.1 hypothetical protein SAMN05877831_103268 [Rhodobacter maris]